MRTPSLLAVVFPTHAGLAFGDAVTPVDPSLLHGQTLVSTEENFSIEAPEGWTWLVTNAGGNRLYACRHGADGPALIVQTRADSRLRMPADAAFDFAEGMAKSARGSGAHDVSIEHSASDQLFPNGHRLVGSFAFPNGAKGRIQGYAGVRGRFYAVFTVFKDDASHAQTFEQFAATFRLLRPVPNVPTLSIGLTFIPVVLIALTSWLAFFVCPWPAGLRRIELLFAIFVLLLVAYMGAAWIGALAGRTSADTLDGVMGQVAGLSLVAFVTTAIVTIVQRMRPASRGRAR